MKKKMYSSSSSSSTDPILDRVARTSLACRVVKTYNSQSGETKMCRLVSDLVYVLPYHSITRCKTHLKTFGALKFVKKRNSEKIVQKVINGFSKMPDTAPFQLSQSPEELMEPILRKCIYGENWDDDCEFIRQGVDALQQGWLDEFKILSEASSKFRERWSDPRYLESMSSSKFTERAVTYHLAIGATMDPKHRRNLFTRLRKFADLQKVKSKSEEKLWSSVASTFKAQKSRAHPKGYVETMTKGLRLVLLGEFEEDDMIMNRLESLRDDTSKSFDIVLENLISRARQVTTESLFPKGPLSVLTEKVQEDTHNAIRTAQGGDMLPMKARLRRALNSLEQKEDRKARRHEFEEEDKEEEDKEEEEENIRETHKAAGVKNVARLLMKTGRASKRKYNVKATPFVVRCNHVEQEQEEEMESYDYDIVLENLSVDATEDEIRKVFSQFGEISKVFSATTMGTKRQKKKNKQAVTDVVRVVRFNSKSAQEAALNQEIQILGLLVRDQMCYTVPPENRTILGVQNICKSHDIETVASELGAILDTTVYSGDERLMDGSWRDDVEDFEADHDVSHALPSLVIPEDSHLHRNEGTCLIEFRNCVDAIHAFSRLANGEILGKRVNLDWGRKFG